MRGFFLARRITLQLRIGGRAVDPRRMASCTAATARTRSSNPQFLPFKTRRLGEIWRGSGAPSRCCDY